MRAHHHAMEHRATTGCMPGRHALAALAAAWLAGATPALAAPAGDWQLRQGDETSAVQVWLRARGDEVPAFRAVTRVQARLATLAALLLDPARMPLWVDRVHSAEPLPAPDPGAALTHLVFDMPWPLDDRDAVVLSRLTQDPATRAITISGVAASERVAPLPGRVRMPSFEASWRFVPLGGGLVEVEFTGFGDPGGSLSSPLLRGFVAAAVWQSPWRTLHALRRVIELPVFRDAVLPAIREPER
jgi:START domain